MVKALRNLLQETSTRDSMKEESQMAMDSIIGRMAATLKEISSRV